MVRNFIKSLLNGSDNQVQSKITISMIGLLCYVVIVLASTFKIIIAGYVFWATVSLILGAAGISEAPKLFNKNTNDNNR